MATLAISEIRHETYDSSLWEEWRLCAKGGKDFLNKFLVKMSERETAKDFELRKQITYVPAFSKGAIYDVRNSLAERLGEVTRDGGPKSYSTAITGQNGGVDRQNSNMTTFIVEEVLFDLLVVSRVGVYIDRMPLSSGSIKEAQQKSPYLYKVSAENILNWRFDDNMKLITLLIRRYEPVLNDFGLIEDYQEVFRLFQLNNDVIVTDYVVMSEKGQYRNEIIRQQTLKLDAIPFVFFELTDSLMRDISGYQIAMLNLASSDMNHVVRANSPFYVEQYDQRSEAPWIRDSIITDGSEASAEAGNYPAGRSEEIQVGVTKGRRVPMGVEMPKFIAPPGEPLRVSMEKQKKLEDEILKLINLAVINARPTRISAEARVMEERGRDAGLSYIGLELERGEQEIANIWASYERSESAKVIYPRRFAYRSEAEVHEEADKLIALKDKISSATFRRRIAKRVATLIFGPMISSEELKQIHDEIEENPTVVADYEAISQDIESGLVSREMASLIRGYPSGQAKMAEKERVKRMQQIAKSQSSNLINPAARGVPELSTEPKREAKEEKK